MSVNLLDISSQNCSKNSATEVGMSLFAQKSSVYGWGYGGLLLLLALFLYRSANDASIEHVSSGEYICTKPDYTIRILSYEPLMMHIENFFTSEEREHLLELSCVTF